MRLIYFFLFLTLLHLAGKPCYGSNSRVQYIVNKGQWPSDILFTSSESSQRIMLLKDGISFSAATSDTIWREREITVWNQRFSGTNANFTIEGEEENASVYTYISKTTPAPIVQPHSYRKVIYRNIYDKIDLCYYGKEDHIEYDYVLHPGADINSIKGYFEGVDEVLITESGDLKVVIGKHIQYQKAPVSWQIINGKKTYVEVLYKLLNDTSFAFAVAGKYDPSSDLIIDPLFQMVWCSYTKATGASNNINYCFANAMDKQGNVYLTGMVDGTYPVTPGSYSGPGGVVPEIFVSKFSSDGTTMLYSTYLPGNSSEFGTDIAVDDSGRAYVTGKIDVNITGVQTFATTPNAYQVKHNGGSDAFLTVLNKDGTGLVYSSFLGGTNSEDGYGVVIGDPGIVYVTGTTSSTDFPLVNSSGFVTGTQNAFVTKFDINQSGTSSVVYSMYFGGGSFSNTSSRSIDVDNAGNVYITGNYQNSFGTPSFPLTSGAYNTVYSTGNDNMIAYAAKLSAALPVSFSYCTYLAPGGANGIAVNSNGEAYITGVTRTFTFPVTTGVLQPVHGQDVLGNANNDAFVMHLNSTGAALIYSTFLGGPENEEGSGIVVNGADEVYVAGIADELFPTSPGATQQNNAGSEDFFVAHINADATAYACGGATYIGGSDEDYTGSFYDYPSPKISLLDYGGVDDTVSVSSTSHSQDFPTTPGVYGPLKVNGIADQPVFFKLTCNSGIVPPLPVAVIQFNVQQGCDTALVDFTDASQNNPVSWTWYFPGSLTAVSNDRNPIDIQYPSAGLYTVSLVACNNAGCDSTSMQVQVNQLQAAVVNLGEDTTICNTASVLLIADTGNVNYLWKFNNSGVGTNDTLIATSAGMYSVEVTNAEGCSATDSIDVTMVNPDAEFTYAFSFGCDGIVMRTENQSTDALKYFWDFGDGTTSEEFNPVHVYEDVNNITIRLVAINGSCSDTMQVDGINFEPAVIDSIPNIITPNGDNVNDCFEIKDIAVFSGCYGLKIFNRWGSQVFESADPLECWDGRSEGGKALPEATYLYLLTLGEKTVNGTVLIKR